MDLQDYFEISKRTSIKNNDEKEILISCMGLAGELGELVESIRLADKYSAKKELTLEMGDYCWYLADISRRHNITCSEIICNTDTSSSAIKNSNNPFSIYLSLTEKTLGIVDYLKKVYGHGHELNNEKLLEKICEAYKCLTHLRVAYDISLEEILDENIKKLAKRYPEGFSTCDSINRYEWEDD